MTLWYPPTQLYITPREEETVKCIFVSAIEGDNTSIIHNIENGVDINAVGHPLNGWGPFGKLPGFLGTPLHYAVGYGNIDTVRLLLEHGARTDIKTRSGYYAREYAVNRGYHEILELLEKYNHNNDPPYNHPQYE
eukprot:TRINITY_DN55009_c0_g1_i1.p1 TRINITY_DN55009_c0_g1~~TRINITY_DN55009_c0_g1_i1.p1  ORF type:complete len:150 (-),score=22.82 TRINITY_DN55009_c0_g1_i1:30-434(-)